MSSPTQKLLRADEGEAGPSSLRGRMTQAAALFASAGVVCFVGLVLAAAGLAQPILFSSSFGFGSAVVSPLVPWGLGLLGFGVMLGFFGAAVKGPSKEWSEIAEGTSLEENPGSPSGGLWYACPGCGADVHSTQATCPQCGYRLTAARTAIG